MQRIHATNEPTLDASSEAGSIDRRTIGKILVDLGKLDARDVDNVLHLHRARGLRFGEAAVKLRLVKRQDVQQALSVQFGYPYLQRGQAVLGGDLVAAYEPYGAQSEALRDLRAQLLTRWFTPERRVLTVVSPDVGDGRSWLVANLAVAFAQWGSKTLVIDADLRNPRQHQLFSIVETVGLAGLLSGRAGLEVVQAIPYFGCLSVLPAGTTPPNPVELVGRPEFARLLTAVKQHYEIILIDTPADVRGADGQTVAARAGGALVLARRDHSRVPDLIDLSERVRASGAQVAGSVLSEF